MSRNLVVQDNLCLLSGDTFFIKERLKSLGCRWDPGKKCWISPATDQALLAFRELGFVSATPAGASSSKELEITEGETRVFSIREFVTLVESLIRRALPDAYWLSGEVSGLRPSNGHFYFDLVENESDLVNSGATRAASISCVLWKGKRAALADKLGDFTLEDGLKIKVLVHCDFRRETSRLSCIIDDIDTAFTLGNLALTRQHIIRELRRRGLYDRNRTTTLPPLPLRVALITAKESRAASDFVDELKQSGFSFSVTLYDSNTQGEATSSGVTRALTMIAEAGHREHDVVILTRGGGSRLDLRWFDDMEICKAIAYCPLPVVTAIGHFEDVSIADEVAWRAEKTPTGAARLLVNAATETLTSLFSRVEGVVQKVNGRLARERVRAAHTEQRLRELVRRRLALEKQQLEHLEQTLRLVRTSQGKTLERGFAIVQSTEGRALTASAFLAERPPENICLLMRDASGERELIIEARVERVIQRSVAAEQSPR